MTSNDEDLRAAWALRESSAPTGADRAARGCPPQEALWQALTLEAPDVERRRVVEHLASCPECAESWRLAAALANAPATAPVARRPAWILPLAASFLVVALGGLFAFRHALVPGTVERAAPLPKIESLLEEGAALPRDGFVLRWTAGPPGTLYDVVVGTSEFKTLGRGTALNQPRYVVSAEALAKLATGAAVTWRVEATIPDGRTAASTTHTNTVR